MPKFKIKSPVVSRRKFEALELENWKLRRGLSRARDESMKFLGLLRERDALIREMR